MKKAVLCPEVAAIKTKNNWDSPSFGTQQKAEGRMGEDQDCAGLVGQGIRAPDSAFFKRIGEP